LVKKRESPQKQPETSIRTSAMFTLIKDICSNKELLLVLAERNIKIRYKNSVLGFFWTLLGPLFLILVYAVFLRVMRFDIDIRVLVTGIIVWQFLAMCLTDSLHSIAGNANLVTKAAFPRIILPISMVTSNLLNLLLSGIVLFLFLIIVKADIGFLPWLPLIIISQYALCLGMALIISCSNVFFKDTEHILSVIMLAWFFLTPIIYPMSLIIGPESALPAWTHIAFFANPMTGIVTSYRMVLLSTPNPGSGLLALSFAVAWLMPIIGIAVFQACQDKFGDEL
jgi:ABC-2 type transport system permease protein